MFINKKIVYILCAVSFSFQTLSADEIRGNDLNLGDLKSSIFYLLKDTETLKKNLDNNVSALNMKIDTNLSTLKNNFDKNILDTSKKINKTIYDANQSFAKYKTQTDKRIKDLNLSLTKSLNDYKKSTDKRINDLNSTIANLKIRINNLEKNVKIVTAKLEVNNTKYDTFLLQEADNHSKSIDKEFNESIKKEQNEFKEFKKKNMLSSSIEEINVSKIDLPTLTNKNNESNRSK